MLHAKPISPKVPSIFSSNNTFSYTCRLGYITLWWQVKQSMHWKPQKTMLGMNSIMKKWHRWLRENLSNQIFLSMWHLSCDYSKVTAKTVRGYLPPVILDVVSSYGHVLYCSENKATARLLTFTHNPIRSQSAPVMSRVVLLFSLDFH